MAVINGRVLCHAAVTLLGMIGTGILACALTNLLLTSWPFSADNMRYVVIAGTAIGGLSSLPLLLRTACRIKRPILWTGAWFFSLCALEYLFTLVLYTL